MSRSVQYYRPPRRVPRTRSEEREPKSRTRDIIFLFVALVVVCIILFGASIFLNQMGLSTIALGVQMLAVILIWVTIGVGFTVGITYFIMRSFLRYEFRKRFDRMDRERHARYRQMMGLDDSEESNEK